ncbi:MAG: hypothetical protein AAF958_16900 [Planctomycetota bacterium]
MTTSTQKSAKIKSFIEDCRRTHGTDKLDELLGKIKDTKVERLLRKHAKMVRGEKWLTRSEVDDIFKRAIVAKGERKVSKRELQDLKYILGYRYSGPKAKTHLVNLMINKGRIRAELKNKVVNDKSFVKRVAAVLRSDRSYPPAGFIVKHESKTFHYLPKHYKEMARRIESGDITLISYDYDNEEQLFRTSRGRHVSDKNQLLIKRGQTGWQQIVVHEATHAIQDWYNIDGTVGDWEAAAHIAQGVRALNVNGPLGKRLRKEKLLDVIKRVQKSKTATSITADEMKDIRKVLAGSYDVDQKRTQPIWSLDNFLEWWKRDG